jgi:hypothetical protein
MHHTVVLHVCVCIICLTLYAFRMNLHVVVVVVTLSCALAQTVSRELLLGLDVSKISRVSRVINVRAVSPSTNV